MNCLSSIVTVVIFRIILTGFNSFTGLEVMDTAKVSSCNSSLLTSVLMIVQLRGLSAVNLSGGRRS